MFFMSEELTKKEKQEVYADIIDFRAILADLKKKKKQGDNIRKGLRELDAGIGKWEKRLGIDPGANAMQI